MATSLLALRAQLQAALQTLATGDLADSATQLRDLGVSDGANTLIADGQRLPAGVD